jgi:arylsulfatase A-like enzyme
VIYTSDQGFFLGDHGLYDKRFMYEESLRMPFLIRWPAAIKPGTVEKSIILNVDFAPTFLDICGLNIPSDIQGRSFLPLLKGEHPSDWRKSFYYRYYHDPGDHNTAAHYGVRTETHKLIYYWKINQWECFDLVNDPLELKNIYNDPDKKEIVNKLKEELYRLKKEVQDNDEFADKLPPSGVDGMNFSQPVKEAIRSAK